MKACKSFALIMAICLLSEPILAWEEKEEDIASSTYRYVTEAGYPQAYSTMTFSSDGGLLAISVAGRTDIINTANEIAYPLKISPVAMAFSRNGEKLLAISTYDRKLVDMTVGNEKDVNGKPNPGRLGLGLEQRNGKLLVSSITPGSPIEKNGEIKIGDELMGIGEGRGEDLQKTLGWSVDNAINKLAGPAGAYVRLTLMPKGKSTPHTHTVRRMPATDANGKTTFSALPKPDLKDRLLPVMRDGRHSFDNASTGQTVVEIGLQNITHFMNAYASTAQRFVVIGREREKSDKYAMEVYDLATQERIAFIPHNVDSFYALEISTDGKEVFVGTWDSIEVYDVASQSHVRRLDLGYKPDPKDSDDEDRGGNSIGRSVIGAARDDLGFGSGPSRDRSPHKLLHHMAVSPRGIVATSDPFGHVTLWDSSSGKKLMNLVRAPELDEKERIEAKDLVFSPNGTHLAYLVEGVLHVANVSHITPQPAGEAAAGDSKPTPKKTWQLAEGVEAEVMSRGTWYPAKLLKRSGELWEVHYADTPDSWNDFVPSARIRQPAEAESGETP